jgi:hypothetical protein
MVRLQQERDIETLRQVGILLDNENKRLIERNRKLTLELARALGLDERQREQMELSLLQELEKSRETIFRSDEQKDENAGAGKDEKKKKKKKAEGARTSSSAAVAFGGASRIRTCERGLRVQCLRRHRL